jgi:hypothetical protein
MTVHENDGYENDDYENAIHEDVLDVVLDPQGEVRNIIEI